MRPADHDPAIDDTPEAAAVAAQLDHEPPEGWEARGEPRLPDCPIPRDEASTTVTAATEPQERRLTMTANKTETTYYTAMPAPEMLATCGTDSERWADAYEQHEAGRRYSRERFVAWLANAIGTARDIGARSAAVLVAMIAMAACADRPGLNEAARRVETDKDYVYDTEADVHAHHAGDPDPHAGYYTMAETSLRDLDDACTDRNVEGQCIKAPEYTEDVAPLSGWCRIYTSGGVIVGCECRVYNGGYLPVVHFYDLDCDGTIETVCVPGNCHAYPQ